MLTLVGCAESYRVDAAFNRGPEGKKYDNAEDLSPINLLTYRFLEDEIKYVRAHPNLAGDEPGVGGVGSAGAQAGGGWTSEGDPRTALSTRAAPTPATPNPAPAGEPAPASPTGVGTATGPTSPGLLADEPETKIGQLQHRDLREAKALLAAREQSLAALKNSGATQAAITQKINDVEDAMASALAALPDSATAVERAALDS